MSRGKRLIFLRDYRRKTDEIIIDCCDKFTLGYIRTWLLENHNEIDYNIYRIGAFYEDYYLASSLKRIRKDFLINNTDIMEIDYYNNENNNFRKLLFPVIRFYINLQARMFGFCLIMMLTLF